MAKRLTCWLAVFLIMAGLCVPVSAQISDDAKVMEKFKKSFAWVAGAESLRKTDIEGMYEVTIPGRILYYFPEKDYVFAGAIWTPNRKNLTEERVTEIATEKIKHLPLEKALKIGSGKNVVIEFTDPDCPYCREASKFLSSHQAAATRYVFFVPLPMHKDAERKVKYIFCSKDRAKTYEEAMSGKLDQVKFEVCSDDKAEKLLSEHKQVSSRIGINSTPQFWINGKHVSGANIALMQSLLGVDAKKAQEK